MTQFCNVKNPFFLGCAIPIAFVVHILLVPVARADVAMPPSMAQRVGQTDVIVIGHVLGLEDQDKLVLPYPGSRAKVPYRIAVVRVRETLRGSYKKKIIKVGFRAPVQPQPGQPILSSRGHWVRLQPGQNGILFLRKHFDESFFTAPAYYDFVRENPSKTYKQQLQRIKELAKLAENPRAGLTAKDPQQRLEAAALLIAKYRTPPRTRPLKTTPIDKQESNLILKVLAEADWKSRGFRPGLPEMPLSPQQLFVQLGIGSGDGFRVTPGRPNGYAEAAQQWLRAHAGTYRIQRFVDSGSK